MRKRPNSPVINSLLSLLDLFWGIRWKYPFCCILAYYWTRLWGGSPAIRRGGIYNGHQTWIPCKKHINDPRWEAWKMTRIQRINEYTIIRIQYHPSIIEHHRILKSQHS